MRNVNTQVNRSALLHQLHPPPRRSLLHGAPEEHGPRPPAGLLPRAERKNRSSTISSSIPISLRYGSICRTVCLYRRLAELSLVSETSDDLAPSGSPSDRGGGDQVVRGVHPDAAHRVRGVRSLPEAALPPAVQRRHQVGGTRLHPPPGSLMYRSVCVLVCSCVYNLVLSCI